MSTSTTVIQSESELPALARQLINMAGECRIFLFDGEMGSGKTTFIKTLCKELGAEEGLSSPTYSIVNEYHSLKNNKIFHFDLYRIKSEAELTELGFEDYIYSGNYCFIEWPEKGHAFYPASVIHIGIENNGDLRTFIFDKQ